MRAAPPRARSADLADCSSPDWRYACGVVIPCLNETVTVRRLVRAVRHTLPTVVVVDDGSSDATAAEASAAGATVLRHPRPEGKGAALRTGLRWLEQHGFAWALLMDGDGQHAPEDIPAFLRQAERSEAGLIVGNRMSAPAGMPWLRRLANRGMSLGLSQFAGRSIPDSQCGFRLLQLPIWSALNLTTSHFEVESEVLLAFLDAGHEVDFIPIHVIYGKEQTKIEPWRDSWRWLSWLWRARSGRKAPQGQALSRTAC
jgi:glycosyltransferase involved in cell wall biosynthesis